MSLTDDDWKEILIHLRRRVQEAGLDALDEQLTVNWYHTLNAREDFWQYFDKLVARLRERSLVGYNKALYAVREAIQVEGGQQVEGIDLVFSEDDARRFGLKDTQLDLKTMDHFSQLVTELEALKAYLDKRGYRNE